MPTTLSILVPLYNEEGSIGEVLDRIFAAPSEYFATAGIHPEVIVVDDVSTDRSQAVVEEYIRSHPASSIRLFQHARNRGKGAAVRTALAHAHGEFSLIQDADLEYDPADYPKLLQPLLAGEADVVIGSRFPGGAVRPVPHFWHTLVNRVLTTFTNIAADLMLTDMASCYKAFRTSLAQSIPLREDRFGFDAELPIKFAQRNARIFEVQIGYRRRSYLQGKKIRPRDALSLSWTIARAGLTRDIYVDGAAAMLRAMEDAPRFNRWMADVVAPFIGDQVLEIGAGIGNLTHLLSPHAREYIVTDIDPEYLMHLNGLIRYRRHVSSAICDLAKPEDFQPFRGRMDTVVCLNVLEHVEDDMTGLKNIYSALVPGGHAVVLVPQGASAFGTFDEVLGHFRRYSSVELTQKMAEAGFRIDRMLEFNRATYPAWLLNGKILRRRTLSRFQLALFDRFVPLLRRIDPSLPWPPTSLIAVGVREK
jgi:glycosyltransferase involved in cell wall biosynthesis